MSEIKPFHAILYDTQKAGDISTLITPPYDVIPASEIDTYYTYSPFNVVRLIRGKQEPGDNKHNNWYLRAKGFFHQWLEKGILYKEQSPCMYLYSQKYHLSGETKSRKGIIALLRLEEFGCGEIFPHEKTMPKPKADRLRLLEATNANFSQPFMLCFEETDCIIEKVYSRTNSQTPIYDFVDRADITHTLWRLDDAALHGEISQRFSPEKLVIADGHHRYETALAFGETKTDTCGVVQDSYNYIPVYICNAYDIGVTILPAHRLLKGLNEFSLDKLNKVLSQHFEFIPCDTTSPLDLQKKLEVLKKDRGCAYCLVGKAEAAFVVMKKGISGSQLLPSFTETLARLDVTVLHEYIFKAICNIEGISCLSDSQVEYIKNLHEVLSVVENTKGAYTFILAGLSADEVKSVAFANEKMPQKSTYFYPKIPSGLVLRAYTNEFK